MSCFLSILLYTDKFFCNDYLDLYGFLRKMEYISSIPNEYIILCNFGGRIMSGFEVIEAPPGRKKQKKAQSE